MEPNKHIVLPRSSELVTFFIQVMAAVTEATSTKYIPLGTNKISVKEKAKDFEFDGDHKDIPFKYIDFIQKTSRPEITFSQEDSVLLKKTVDAAYYFFKEKGDVSELIEKYYTLYFRTK